MNLLIELKRRNVFRMAGLYLVAAWLITQVASTVLPMFGAPEWLPRSIVLVLAIGFMPALLFAWVFELTPEGLKRESEIDRSQSISSTTAQRMEHLIVVLLALALGYFAFDKFVLGSRREALAQQQKTTEVAAALKQGSTEGLIKSYGDKSIAVLPFANMSGDKEQEYFSDGISEELLNQLAKISNLRVIARTSSFAYKGKDVKVEHIAKELNVAHILEGSIRKSGNTVRITAQLIRSADSSHLWSETYDRQMTDIFAVQDEISAAVVAQLKIKLLGAVPTTKAVNPQAYELFLQGRALAHLRTPESLSRAIELLQQALVFDRTYAAAWAQLSPVYYSQVGNGLRPVAEGVRLAREAVNKAIALDPDYAPAHAYLARIAMTFDSDLAATAQHVNRALALAPEDGDVLRVAALFTSNLGRLPAATALYERLTARDPANPVLLSNSGLAYQKAGRWDEAIARYRQALALSPGAMNYHYHIAMALLHQGQAPAALAELQLEPEAGGWVRIGLPMVWHALDDRAKSDAALAELIQKDEKDSAYNIAYVYAFRGEADQAFAWLDKAVAYQDGGLAEIVLQPEFANIRQDPRWLPFLRKLGKAPEQLDAIVFEVEL